MAYNFKSIADVEVVAEPNESANVLIEENGVIKRVPRDKFASEEEFDIIIFAVCNSWDDNNEYNVVKIISYDDIMLKLEQGIFPRLYLFINDCGNYNMYERCFSQSWWRCQTEDNIDYISFSGYGFNYQYYIDFYPDGTVDIEFGG